MGSRHCSDKTFTSTSTVISDNAKPTTFLPLEPGLRVSYIVSEPESQYYDLEVTNPANIAGNPGYAIRKTDRNTGETEIFYRYTKDNAIFESGSTSYPGVRILESPFVIGNSWDRFDNVTDAGTIITGDIIIGDLDDDDILPGNTLKTIPGDGYSTMSIVGIESVEALNGISYGSCIKVAWQTDEYIYNYYWYAAGIGLVKYEQNCNLLAASDNRTVGVMTDYQVVQY